MQEAGMSGKEEESVDGQFDSDPTLKNAQNGGALKV